MSLLDKDISNYECRAPDNEEFKDFFLYNGTFPKLEEKYFSDRTAKAVCYDNWNIFEMFKSERRVEALYSTKLAKCMFEAINTLWFVCLEIFVRNKKIQMNDALYTYAFDKVFIRATFYFL